MAEQTLAPFNMINLGQRANMQLPNIGSIVDTSPGQLVVLHSLKGINLAASSAQSHLKFTTEFIS